MGETIDVIVPGDQQVEVDGEAVDLPSRSMGDLAAIANREHASALGAVRQSVLHAIRAGEALLAAREKAPADGWLKWLSENFDGGQATGQQYMRLAYYKDRVLDGPQSVNLKQAYLYLRGLPAIDGTKRRVGGFATAPDEVVQEAKKLRREGQTLEEIEDALGYSARTVQRWLDPEARKRWNANRRAAYRRRKDEAQALKRQERDRAVKRAGGTASHAYAHLRKCASDLQRAIDETESREAEAHLRQALADLYRSEDEIVLALGIDDGMTHSQREPSDSGGAA